MIVKNELLKKIKDLFSLNIYETKVWVALLSKGVATVGEVAEISGVPRSRAYDVLESLDKQGFTIQKMGKPVKYLAVKPEVVLERLKNNITKEAEEKAEVLSNLKDTPEYKEINLLHKLGINPIRADELSGVVNGRSNFYAFLHELISNATKELIVISPASTLTKKSKILKQLKDTSKKGVDVKIGINSKSDEIDIKALENEISNVKRMNIDGRFFIADRKKVLFITNSESADEDQDRGVWINSEFFANSISSLFDVAWKSK